jgi:hypothetical protein
MSQLDGFALELQKVQSVFHSFSARSVGTDIAARMVGR